MFRLSMYVRLSLCVSTEFVCFDCGLMAVAPGQT